MSAREHWLAVALKRVVKYLLIPAGLVIALERGFTTVPDVEMLPRGTAIDILTDEGLPYVVERIDWRDTGIVVKQRPRPGAFVFKDKSVVLYVSAAPDGSARGAAPGVPTVVRRRVRIPAGTRVAVRLRRGMRVEGTQPAFLTDAELAEPLMTGTTVLAPKRATVTVGVSGALDGPTASALLTLRDVRQVDSRHLALPTGVIRARSPVSAGVIVGWGLLGALVGGVLGLLLIVVAVPPPASNVLGAIMGCVVGIALGVASARRVEIPGGRLLIFETLEASEGSLLVERRP